MAVYAIREPAHDQWIMGLGEKIDGQRVVYSTRDADTAFAFGHVAAVCLKASLDTFFGGEFVIEERA